MTNQLKRTETLKVDWSNDRLVIKDYGEGGIFLHKYRDGGGAVWLERGDVETIYDWLRDVWAKDVAA